MHQTVQSPTGHSSCHLNFEIFITHDSQDRDLAQWLYDVLDRVGVKPCLGPGDDILASCKGCVAFITPNSAHSSKLRREMAKARAHSIPVIPLVERGVTSGRFKSPITYHPFELDQLAYNLIYRLREMIYGHEQRPGLKVQCVDGHEQSVMLPASEQLKEIIRHREPLEFICWCGKRIEVSAYTFEEALED